MHPVLPPHLRPPPPPSSPRRPLSLHPPPRPQPCPLWARRLDSGCSSREFGRACPEDRTERRGWRHGGHRVRGQHRRADIDRVRATTTPSWVRERLGASSAVECRGQSRPAGCTAGLCDHIGCPWRSGEDAATSGRWLHQPLLTAASVCVALSPITLASRAHLAPTLHALRHPQIIIINRPLPSTSPASTEATTSTQKCESDSCSSSRSGSSHSHSHGHDH